MSILTESLAAIAAAAASLPRDSATLSGLHEDELLALPALFASVSRQLVSATAAVAGELARRSSPELGYRGLAQKAGFRTPAQLVKHLTGSTGRQAHSLVRAGALIHESEFAANSADEVPASLTMPWLVSLGRAVAAGELSLDAADAIRTGLGAPTTDVAADALAAAAERLVGEASNASAASPVHADELLIRARMLRDELDEAGIVDRERALRAARSFRRHRRGDGMTAYTLLADPENAALVDGIYDSLTSPRRGGPRMVDPSEKERDAVLDADHRSTEQLAFDGLLAVLRIGAASDGKTAAERVLGSRRPAVRVLVSQRTLETRRGLGRIEGHPAPVSVETVERHICDTGIVPIAFDDDGQCINVGREQRLFTARQRIALAARDGGCRWPGCERPASWAEAHHITQWARDGGRTDVADGILLCRHHHLLLHDNHWDIKREGGRYCLLPPASEDPQRTPRPMPHKSAALRDLLREHEPPSAPRRPTPQGSGAPEPAPSSPARSAAAQSDQAPPAPAPLDPPPAKSALACPAPQHPTTGPTTHPAITEMARDRLPGRFQDQKDRQHI